VRLAHAAALMCADCVRRPDSRKPSSKCPACNAASCGRARTQQCRSRLDRRPAEPARSLGNGRSRFRFRQPELGRRAVGIVDRSVVDVARQHAFGALVVGSEIVE
jgi:hypothetical protein